jgi:hypothetical protein
VSASTRTSKYRAWPVSNPTGTGNSPAPTPLLAVYSLPERTFAEGTHELGGDVHNLAGLSQSSQSGRWHHRLKPNRIHPLSQTPDADSIFRERFACLMRSGDALMSASPAVNSTDRYAWHFHPLVTLCPRTPTTDAINTTPLQPPRCSDFTRARCSRSRPMQEKAMNYAGKASEKPGNWSVRWCAAMGGDASWLSIS